LETSADDNVIANATVGIETARARTRIDAFVADA